MMTNKELHKYFYEKHQSFWEKVIEVAKKKRYPYIVNVKREVKKILYPNIELFVNCFGCHFVYTPKSLNCKKCFLNLKCFMCKNSYWSQLTRMSNKKKVYFDKKEFIKLCKKIRNCGFHITRSKTRMMKLYKEMNK